MKVVLISSHYLGVLYLQELLAAGDDVAAAVALPGDGGWYIPPEYDFRQAAFRSLIPVYEPPARELNGGKFLRILAALEPDFIVSGYYPRLFSRALLAIPKNGCVNTHPTGLPRYRGLSPYFTHLLFGDEQNTITIHWLDEGIDTGDIIAQASVPILETDTGFTTGHKVTEAGRDAFREVWPLIKSGKAPRRRQDEREACTFNFSWDLAQIDWNRPARDVWNLVRALTRPLAGSWTLLLGRKLLVWSARMVAEEGGRRSCSSPAPCASSWADNRNRGG
jgi:UDP-4-amino-4-deoxy-L-arabinose formyltransferase/UDP-glucuronic acid dehydrogenase (UDP-4-keto-hexauronic acid decarboxylating)